MKDSWINRALIAGVLLSTCGLIRTVLLLKAPAAADLPEPLRSTGPSLLQFHVKPNAVHPASRDRDVAWGPRYTYHIFTQTGPTLGLELVVIRRRYWMQLPELKAARKVLLDRHQQVMLGSIQGMTGLRTCLVGRSLGRLGPQAIVDNDELGKAIIEWSERLDQSATIGHSFQRKMALLAGTRVSERWECLLVTLWIEKEGTRSSWLGRRLENQSLLIKAWRDLFPQLKPWGESWEGVQY